MNYANFYGYSDVEPYEIIKWISPKTIEIRAMSCKELPWKKDIRVGGFSACFANQYEQKWEISSNPNGEILRARLNSKGKWKSKMGYHRLSETPSKFYDYNF